MKPFLMFLYSRPFFAVCFIFSAIPFWVPLLALIAGADPVLMLLISVLSMVSKAYVDSEISFRDPIRLMLSYFLAKPFISAVKLILFLSAVALLAIYGMKGEPLDKAISSLLMVYAFIKLYLGGKKHRYWNIKGLGIYRLYSIGGRLLTAFLWIAFFILNLGVADSIAVAFTALLVHSLTFFKVNEGLL